MRRWALLAGFALLLAGAVFAWRYYRPVPPVPPLPANIQEADVLEVVEKAREEVRNSPRSAEAWGNLGMVLLAHLFDREADVCFAAAARLNPDEPRWPYARGLLALKRDPANAVALLRQAATAPGGREEDQPVFRLQLAEALLERQELDEAEELFRDELRRQPGNARAALGLGLTALAKGKDAEAEELLALARKSPYARRTAVIQLAALARSRGGQAAADALGREAAELPADPPWPDPLLDETVHLQVGRRGRMRLVARLEEERRFAEAAEVYLRQLEREPSAEAHVGAGVNLLRLKEYERAFPLLREAVRLDPASANAQYTLALGLFRRAEEEHLSPNPAVPLEQRQAWFREVVERARKATELKPDHAHACAIWGLALKHLGKPAEAVAPFRQAAACQPGNLEIQLGLGEALLAAGREGEAEKHLENAVRLTRNPADRRAAQALERLRAGK